MGTSRLSCSRPARDAVKDISPLEPLATRPLPEIAVALVRDVHAAATATGIPWFVGGASARDILLPHIHDINPARATADVDIGISIET
jgi:predicted nucleotidyltransferase